MLKALLTNCAALLQKRNDGIRYGIVNALRNIHATAVVIFMSMWTACVNFKSLCVIITMCWLSFSASGGGSEKFIISTESNSPVAERNCRWCLCSSVVPLLAHLW